MASAPRPFVHLHLHSMYSLLDGGNHIKKLAARARELEMPAMALTDHGNLHGAVEFYNACKDEGVKPILGIEAYVAPDIDGRISDRRDRTYTGNSDNGFHLVLLAENQIGWANLLKLSSDAYLEGFYFKPRMDKSTLEKWSQGIIAINGHLGSSLAHYLRRYEHGGDEANYQAAVREAKWHAETFKPNDEGEPCFFIELQRHDEQEQEAINPHLIRLARELELPLVCDNDAHFLTAEDHDAHDTLCCISMGKQKFDENRLRYGTQLYVKSPAEMVELFDGYGDGAGDEALANTAAIAERCNVELDFTANHAPVVKITTRFEQKLAEMTTDPQEAAAFVRSFACEHPIGSTPWFKAFCAQFELEPYDEAKDSESSDDLKQQCDVALRLLTEAGAVWRYGADNITDEIRARMDRELGILADKLISAYFLIVWDFCNFARSEDIPVNARGSGVGTMVGFCLGLSNACPVRYGLLFERFTDPDRSEYPDIDIDICQNGRARVLDYVRQKYGYVAQIITFGTLGARAVIKDVARVMAMPVADSQRLCNLVPDELKITLEGALEKEPDLKKAYETSPEVKRVIDTGMRLEGLARHASVHAAGVVVATQPLENIVPLYKASNSEDVITQWDGPTCEKVGLLKMDFLGLRTLSVIDRACALVRATLDLDTQRRTIFTQGPVADSPREYTAERFDPAEESLPAVDPLDLDRLNYLDQNVLDLFRRGETAGVFQFESDGMRQMLISMKPDQFEDLIAAAAMYRPGPMDLIPDFIDRKHGKAAVPRVHPIADKFTADTYGIMVYQEQVMQIVHELGGIPLRTAYSLIKAISKKKEKQINASRENFLEGAVERGLDKKQAADLFDLILKFAGYGFNKSHSTGYAIVAYQTAFLKAYFPVQYMAALLTYESGNTDKIVKYIDAAKRVRLPDGRTGIDVRSPDINKSFEDFSVVFDPDEPHDASHGHIRFGLCAVKGVGSKAVQAIIKAREDQPFTSLFDFCERIPPGVVTKSTVEALIKCGAFDELHGTDKRAAMVAAVESAMQRGAQEAALRTSDDFLFGAVADASKVQEQQEEAEPDLPTSPPWETTQALSYEKEVLGFYVSSHPMDKWRSVMERFCNVEIAHVPKLRQDTPVTLAGMLTRVRPTITKNGRNPGQKMAMITIEDWTGSMDGVLFSDAYARYAEMITQDNLVFLKGKVDRKRETPNIIVEQVIAVDRASEELCQAVKIALRTRTRDGVARKLNGELRSLQGLLKRNSGNAAVLLEIQDNGSKVLMRVPDLSVKVDAMLPARIDTLLQDDQTCQLLGPKKLARSNGRAFLGDGETENVQRLQRNTIDHACDSIDRY